MSSGRKTLCVFSSSSEGIDEKYLKLAAQLGGAMAARGIDLVSGGGSISTMGVLARTVRSGGGHTIGVIPRQMLAWDVSDNDADELLVTEDMRTRKGLMDAHSDGFLALPGGLGTIEELLEAWVGRTLGMHRKPIVILDPWDDFGHLRELVEAMCRTRLVRPGAAQEVMWATEVAESLKLIQNAWDSGEGRGADLPPVPTGHPSEWLEAD